MLLQQTTGALRDLCDRMFGLAEELAGAPPQLRPDGWYRAEAGGRPFVYLRIIGDGARTVPTNAVHLATRWDQSLQDEGVTEGNNWFGETSADLVARVGNPEEIKRAEDFIRRAFALYRG